MAISSWPMTGVKYSQPARAASSGVISLSDAAIALDRSFAIRHPPKTRGRPPPDSAAAVARLRRIDVPKPSRRLRAAVTASLPPR